MEWIHTRWRKTENAELTEESHLEGSPILKERSHWCYQKYEDKEK